MGNFIMGVLVQNKDGATYEGVVYDRRLTLRLPNGRELSVFDPADPISTTLHIGEVYEMVLVPFVVSVNLVPLSQSSAGLEAATESNNWQGTVIDPNWEAQKNAFRLVRTELYEQRWVHIATPLGNIIIRPESVGATLNIGTVVQWKSTRLDLYAVV
jgi:hypothetical protein